MRKRLGVFLRRSMTAFCVAAAAVGGSVYPALPQSTPRVVATVGDEWLVVFFPKAEREAFCAVARRYQDGEWLHFERFQSGARELAVFSPEAPEGDEGTIVKTTISFANGAGIQSEAIEGIALKGEEGSGVKVRINDAISTGLRRSTSVSVAFSGFVSASLDLAGSGQAMDAAEKCAKDQF